MGIPIPLQEPGASKGLSQRRLSQTGCLSWEGPPKKCTPLHVENKQTNKNGSVELIRISPCLTARGGKRAPRKDHILERGLDATLSRRFALPDFPWHSHNRAFKGTPLKTKTCLSFREVCPHTDAFIGPKLGVCQRFPFIAIAGSPRAAQGPPASESPRYILKPRFLLLPSVSEILGGAKPRIYLLTSVTGDSHDTYLRGS